MSGIHPGLLLISSDSKKKPPLKTMGPVSELGTTEHMKTELTQHTKSFQRFCALGRALFTGCCILGNYYVRNRSINAKLLSAPRAFLWNAFMGFWISLNLRAHSPLSSFHKLPRASYNTSDVKRVFSSHFIGKQIKVLQLLLCFLLGRKKVGIFPFFCGALYRTNVQMQDNNERTLLLCQSMALPWKLKIQGSCPGAWLQGQNYRCQHTYQKKYARRDR